MDAAAMPGVAKRPTCEKVISHSILSFVLLSVNIQILAAKKYCKNGMFRA